jgi:hypothetical protein
VLPGVPTQRDRGLKSCNAANDDKNETNNHLAQHCSHILDGTWEEVVIVPIRLFAIQQDAVRHPELLPIMLRTKPGGYKSSSIMAVLGSLCREAILQ